MIKVGSLIKIKVMIFGPWTAGINGRYGIVIKTPEDPCLNKCYRVLVDEEIHEFSKDEIEQEPT